MTAHERVLIVLLLLAPLLVLVVAMTIVRAIVLAYLARKWQRDMSAARRLLVRASTSPGMDVQPLRELSVQVQVRALIELGRSVTGPELINVRAAADKLGIPRKAEKMCTSRAWWRRTGACAAGRGGRLGGRPPRR